MTILSDSDLAEVDKAYQAVLLASHKASIRNKYSFGAENHLHAFGAGSGCQCRQAQHCP